MMVGKNKNLTEISIIVFIVLVAGALIYVDLSKDLRERKEKTLNSKIQSKINQSSTETSPIETIPSEENTPNLPTAVLIDFAKCLKEKGVKFYGSSLCDWCTKQKEIFGEASEFLPYVECFDQQTQDLTKECQNANIVGVPTWEFAEKGQVLGFKTLKELSELSGCSLPTSE